MKRTKLLCGIALSFLMVTVFGQGLTKTYQTPLTGNENVVAAKRIVFKSGFRTNGHRLTTDIDRSAVEAYMSTSPMNWVQTINYGEKGAVVASSIGYFNKLGKPVQSVSQNIGEEKVIATQTLYDSKGRPYISTLPTVVDQQSLNYINNMVDESSIALDGTTGDPLVYHLSKYYSQENEMEAYVPEDRFAYSKIRYSTRIPGNELVHMPGEVTHALFSHSYSLPVSPDEFKGLGIHSVLNLETLKIRANPTEDDAFCNNLIKSVSIAPDGQEMISYSDIKGQAVASCMSSKTSEQHLWKYEIPLASGYDYVDIHLPNKEGNYTITKSSGWSHEFIDLVTDNSTTNTSGATSIINIPPGVYRIVCLDGTIGATVEYMAGYKYHSFVAYDIRGNAIRTLTPKDVEEIDVAGSVSPGQLEERITKSTYDAKGQMLSSYSQDEGLTEYKYRKDGKIRFSQNAKQRAEGYFSYSNYDQDGRVVEVGEVNESISNIYFVTIGAVSAEDADYYLERSYSPEEGLEGTQLGCRFQSFTLYDEADPNFPFLDREQKFLKGKASSTWNDHAQTWYSYNYEGNIEFMVQEIVGFNKNGDDIVGGIDDLVTVDYEYDLLGNATQVTYQRGEYDEFVHNYAYDFDNRLEHVATEFGALRQKQARYSYYAHGPLERTELGGNIQGVDFVYNIHGWLKSMNHPEQIGSKDPGLDGEAGSLHAHFAPDAFSMALDYYAGDYNRTGTNFGNAAHSQNYDGNIAAQRWNTASLADPVSGNQHAWQFDYDERKFMAKANYGSAAATTGTFAQNIDGAYAVYGVSPSAGISYDANGNIEYLSRNGSTGTQIDKFSYHYLDGRNQLNFVNDEAGNGGADDLHSQINGNYGYNQIGQLISNAQDAHYFEYDVYGKTTQVKPSEHGTPFAEYVYDDRGFRIKKHDTKTGTGKETYYVRDINGSILAIYTKEGSNSMQLQEIPVYGATRLGMAQIHNNGIGKYTYELRDQVSNVRAVVSSPSTTQSLELLSATDYYPGGMEMYGRTNALENYRFGYQGEFAEKDGETGYDQFELRLYDKRIGRWLVPDPFQQFWSPYLNVANNPITGIDPTGGLMPDFFYDGENNLIDYVPDNGLKGNPNRVFVLGGDGGYEHDGMSFTQIMVPSMFYDYGVAEIKQIRIDDFNYAYSKYTEEWVPGWKLTKTMWRNIKDPDNTGTVVEAGFDIATCGAAGKVTGWITKKTFKGLSPALRSKFVSAIKKGIVPREGYQGIIKLTPAEIAEKGLDGYTHKLKILGKGGDKRIYGKMGENGHIVFDKVLGH